MVCIDITQEELGRIIESLEYILLHTNDNYDRIETMILLNKLEKE
jgi:hypothetical protein